MSGFGGALPYLLCRDAGAEADWLIRVYGFTEKSRWHDDAGNLTNVELLAGETEIWLDHDPGGDGPPNPAWLGLWVDDVEAMRARVQASGIDCPPPRDRTHGVREFGVTDPEGIAWGFLQRIEDGA